VSRFPDKPKAWVTGGSRGIGLAITAKLEELGLVVSSYSSDDFDLGNKDSRQSFLNKEYDWPDVLILNAGVNYPNHFDIQSQETFYDILEVNFLANVDLLRTIVPKMKSNSFGRIVAISSLFAGRAKKGRSAYSSSKAALEALVRHIAVENAEFGILANIVTPGFVDTELTRQNNSESEIRALESRIPMQRLAQPSEIAEIVAFLVSPQNSYITGQNISVDGGVSLL
jgi:3-oxoacyl-[acyl-carrier protein] reductase